MNRHLSKQHTAVNWQALAELHAETLRQILLDLAFDRRTALTDSVVDRAMKALSHHREVTA